MFREGARRIANLPDADARLVIALNRGALESANGNSAAETILKQVIAEARKLKGERGEIERSATDVLLELYEREKSCAKLVELQRAAVAAARRTVPATSLHLAGNLAALSVSLLRAGRAAEAGPVFEEAYRIFRRHDAGEGEQLNLKIQLGESLLLLGRRDEALPLIEAVYEFARANLPPKHRYRVRAEAVYAESRAGARPGAHKSP